MLFYGLENKVTNKEILGLDSLFRQAYNPAPSFENENLARLQFTLIEGLKNKVTNKEILGLDSLLRQAYNPAPLSQSRNDNWTKVLP